MQVKDDIVVSGSAGASAAEPGLSRRTFIRLASVGLAGFPLLLEACGSSSSAPASSPAGTSSAAAGARAVASAPAAGSGLAMPVHVALAGPQPDLPATSSGVPPAFFNYPKQHIKSVATPPGKGEDITATSFFLGPPPTPLAKNVAWQEVNKQLNANLKVTPVSVADYFTTRLPTLIASGNLPDIFLESALNSTLQNEPAFLAAQCSDLTPYLSGSAIKAYPNLANLPSYVWKSTVFNNKIWAVPLAKGGISGVNGTTMLVKQAALDAAGIGAITTLDDFTKAMKELTNAANQRWGLGGTGVAPQNPAEWFGQLYGVPNGWRNQGGKLTKDWETPEFKASVAYMRSLWDAGYIFPDTPSLSGAQIGADWYAGKYAMWPNSFIAFSFAWDAALSADPNFKPRALTPFSADGKVKPAYHSGTGSNGRTVLKKASAARIQELLGVLNFFAAPFGSQEQELLNFGVTGVDFTLDANGNPKETRQGGLDVNVPWSQLATGPAVLYDAGSKEFAQVAHDAEAAHYALAVPNPVDGLYSKTHAEKDQSLTQKVMDGVTQIVYGRSPVSSLDGLVKAWQSGGGEQMRSEFQDALQKAG